MFQYHVDTDTDGIPDYFEEYYYYFELYSDLDGDGYTDFYDYDRDGDGINGGRGESHKITFQYRIWKHYNRLLGRNATWLKEHYVTLFRTTFKIITVKLWGFFFNRIWEITAFLMHTSCSRDCWQKFNFYVSPLAAKIQSFLCVQSGMMVCLDKPSSHALLKIAFCEGYIKQKWCVHTILWCSCLHHSGQITSLTIGYKREWGQGVGLPFGIPGTKNPLHCEVGAVTAVHTAHLDGPSHSTSMTRVAMWPVPGHGWCSVVILIGTMYCNYHHSVLILYLLFLSRSSPKDFAILKLGVRMSCMDLCMPSQV